MSCLTTNLGCNCSSKSHGLEQLEHSKKLAQHYSSDKSIGSQSLITAVNDCRRSDYNYLYCCSPISLKSSRIRSVRVSVDFYFPAGVTGSIKILSVPSTFSAPWTGCGTQGFAALHPLFDLSNTRCVSSWNNYAEISVVMRGNVSSGVTCLYVLPFVSKDTPEGFVSYEALGEVDYEVPHDHQVIVLFTASVRLSYAYDGIDETGPVHVFADIQ
ncbi:hypothetical protein TWF106_006653 [Orbilia oligospora]|uniref:Uncharacterized protein n=1 Tax=Orbilia oligospora TaxID=2813651 RepID=A0A6G1M499_ORBOL|nr:hypothetical protein TWF788_002118 [Orbilia oligospora]KAF3201023.1 hypothetical protein TWF679_000510 [Orbilia oligospora]KAF3211622.1 hypothetical protein TWF191_010700 [Orbilia oligospora]KAF3220593.1 hypothetical protein TWF106_006653 [Orbilia oligospora]KAF3243443.1 hypothetical protein TWF192_008350 [Orbilia oligospora]